jgi:hypothetical protein
LKAKPAACGVGALVCAAALETPSDVFLAMVAAAVLFEAVYPRLSGRGLRVGR